MYRWKTEGAERDINNAVCAEDDNKPDDAPHDGSLPFGSLRFIPRSLDEFKHAPKEEDKSRGREKQDKRIDYLYDDAPEKFVENGWNLPYHLLANLNACFWRTARRPGAVTEANRTRKDIHETPDGDHHEETNEAIEHETLALFFRLFRGGSYDKRLKDTPKEDDKGDGEEDGNEHVVDGIDNERAGVREVVDGGERDERQGEGGKRS